MFFHCVYDVAPRFPYNYVAACLQIFTDKTFATVLRGLHLPEEENVRFLDIEIDSSKMVKEPLFFEGIRNCLTLLEILKANGIPRVC